jgi:hypothetical protein
MSRAPSFHSFIRRSFLSSRALVVLAVAATLLASCARGTGSPIAESTGEQPSPLDASEPSPICARYLGCVAKESNAGGRFAELSIAYGAGAACWSGDASLASDCSEACREGALAISRCGECDEDDACQAGLACIDNRCEAAGCRIDARRANALVDAACACGDSCGDDTAFVHLLARASAETECATPFAAWVGCELEAGPCRNGMTDFYASCENELARLTACENQGTSLRCR